MTESFAITASKCARHLDMPALSVCERCGDYICLRCLCDHDGHLYCPDCLAVQPAGAKPSARVLAHLIDVTIFVVPTGLLFAAAAIAFGFVVGARQFPVTPFPTWMMLVVVSLSVALISVVQLMLVSHNGQSIGKRVMNLRVVMLNGERVGVWRVLLLRNLAPLLLGSIPFVGFVFRIANVAALFSDGNRTIHDRFAGTKVIAVTPNRETTS